MRDQPGSWAPARAPYPADDNLDSIGLEDLVETAYLAVHGVLPEASYTEAAVARFEQLPVPDFIQAVVRHVRGGERPQPIARRTALPAVPGRGPLRAQASPMQAPEAVRAPGAGPLVRLRATEYEALQHLAAGRHHPVHQVLMNAVDEVGHTINLTDALLQAIAEAISKDAGAAGRIPEWQGPAAEQIMQQLQARGLLTATPTEEDGMEVVFQWLQGKASESGLQNDVRQALRYGVYAPSTKELADHFAQWGIRNGVVVVDSPTRAYLTPAQFRSLVAEAGGAIYQFQVIPEWA